MCLRTRTSGTHQPPSAYKPHGAVAGAAEQAHTHATDKGGWARAGAGAHLRRRLLPRGASSAKRRLCLCLRVLPVRRRGWFGGFSEPWLAWSPNRVANPEPRPPKRPRTPRALHFPHPTPRTVPVSHKVMPHESVRGGSRTCVYARRTKRRAHTEPGCDAPAGCPAYHGRGVPVIVQ